MASIPYPSLHAEMRIIAFAIPFGSPHKYTPCPVFQDGRYYIQAHARVLHMSVKTQYPAITMQFQVLVTSCQGSFSVFPHGTSALSVLISI